MRWWELEVWDFWAWSHEGLRVGPGHCVGGAIPQGLLRLAFWTGVEPFQNVLREPSLRKTESLKSGRAFKTSPPKNEITSFPTSGLDVSLTLD